ncbi:MAG: hypothetical protein V1779_12425 [bacterium]
MSQERAFMENLLSQRFNYFLLFFSIIVIGFSNTYIEKPILAQIIVFLGSIVIFLLALTLKRSQCKLDLILEKLLKDPNHPVKIINDLAGKGSRRKLIGIWIPTICYLILFASTIVHLFILIYPCL